MLSRCQCMLVPGCNYLLAKTAACLDSADVAHVPGLDCLRDVWCRALHTYKTASCMMLTIFNSKICKECLGQADDMQAVAGAFMRRPAGVLFHATLFNKGLAPQALIGTRPLKSIPKRAQVTAQVQTSRACFEIDKQSAKVHGAYPLLSSNSAKYEPATS